MENLYDIAVNTIDGQTTTLGEYAGKTLLIVNVASKCGLTPQYAGLQALHERLQSRGFSVLGFPCNQFLEQEPGSNADIQAFCSTQYNVGFPLFSKLEVNGEGRHPLFAWLVAQAVGPAEAGDIRWNFEKFVINGHGRATARFAPTTTPEDETLLGAIEDALKG